jgi:tetratricopeptide (TPR) repeat protein
MCLSRPAARLLVALAALVLAPRMTAAQSTTCADEFRSGKLYFQQQLNEKSVERFAAAVAGCPDKGEYHARYAMALCQRGDELLNQAFTKADTREAREALLEEARRHYRLAGAAFDTAAVVEPKKSLLKFVRENRDHYWVDHYNRALEFLKDDAKIAVADVEFGIARLIAPLNPKAYSQGAVARVKLEDRDGAMALVKQGLAIAPEDKQLNELLETLYQSAAEDYIQRAQENKDPAKAAEGEALVDKLLERRGEDGNLYFLRAILRTTRGAAHMAGNPAQEDSARMAFRGAAEDFAKAAALIPPDKDQGFHQDALFNQIQALVSAGEYDPAMKVISTYLSLNYAEATIWKFMSLCLLEKGEQNQGVAALMVSKSIEGGVIADSPEKVKMTVEGAIDDAAASLSQQGPPEFVYGYQEQSSGNQIQTWFWPAKRTVMSFILGKKNGELTW